MNIFILECFVPQSATARNANNLIEAQPRFASYRSPLGHSSYLIVSSRSGTGEGDKRSGPQGVECPTDDQALMDQASDANRVG
jgi:hypothetical protein